jgi:hypothetical protein
MTVTLVVGGERRELDGEARDHTLVVGADALHDATGWELRPEGLCRGDVCVPRRPNDHLLVDDRIDIVAFGAALRRPVALEASAGIAVLADSPEEHAEAIAGGTAPPFTLPDLDGNPVSLTDFHGRKKLLLAWASW